MTFEYFSICTLTNLPMILFWTISLQKHKCNNNLFNVSNLYFSVYCFVECYYNLSLSHVADLLFIDLMLFICSLFIFIYYIVKIWSFKTDLLYKRNMTLVILISLSYNRFNLFQKIEKSFLKSSNNRQTMKQQLIILMLLLIK